MMPSSTEHKQSSFFDVIKNLFILLLFLQFAPMLFTNVKEMFMDMLTPKAQVGKLTFSGSIKDSAFYVSHIQRFLKNDSIKALYLKIDSHGGIAGSTQAIFQELLLFKKKKPIIAFIENAGTSAAYKIAAASDHIIATSSSLIGSIGSVLETFPNIKELANKWHIKFRDIHTGAYKMAGHPFTEDTAAELKLLQNLSDDLYKDFVECIAQARDLPIEQSKIWANGKIFTGRQALTLKLIDQLGSQQDVIDQLKKLALIETDIKFVQPKSPSPLLQFIKGDDDLDFPETSLSSWVTNLFRRAFITLFTQDTESLNSAI